MAVSRIIKWKCFMRGNKKEILILLKDWYDKVIYTLKQTQIEIDKERKVVF